jgi:hypothetical protein
MVESPDETASRKLPEDVFQTVVGFAGSPGIIEGQQHSSERLNQKQKHRDTAKNLVPPRRGRNVFI